MRVGVPVVALMIAACDGESAGLQQQRQFALEVPQRVEVRSGETTVVALLAVGASGQVSYGADGLPPFAVLDGSTLRISPRPWDPQGEWTVTVTANDGSASASATFTLALLKPPLAWSISPMLGDGRRSGLFAAPSTAPVEIEGQPIVGSSPDPSLQICGELRPVGEGMTGTPTLCGAHLLLLPLMEFDKHYALQIWLRDSTGSTSSAVGWTDLYRTRSGPDAAVLPPFFETDMDPDQGLWQTQTISLHGLVTLTSWFVDLDLEAVQLFVEVQPMGTAFTGTPNHQSDVVSCPVVAGYGLADRWCSTAAPGQVHLLVGSSLPDLAIGTHYHIDVWMRDAAGVESQHWTQPDFVRVQ